MTHASTTHASTKHPARITGAIVDAATLPAGFRLEPKRKVVILSPVIVDGEDAAIGDEVEVDANRASILVGEGLAKFPEIPAPAPGAPASPDAPAADAPAHQPATS